MKKIILLLIGIVVFSLSGCKDKDDYTPETIYDFGDDPISSKEDITEKITFYIDKLTDLLDNNSLNNQRIVNLSDSTPKYTKDDFNELTKLSTYIDEKEVDAVKTRLEDFKEDMDNCTDFIEGEFCAEGLSFDSTIMAKTREDKLYLEYYFSYDEGTKVKYGGIMFFDLVEELLYFEFVREDNRLFEGNIHSQKDYDKFSEEEYSMSIDIYSSGSTRYSYHNYDDTIINEFVIGNQSPHSYYWDSEKGVMFYTSYNSDLELSNYSIRFNDSYKYALQYYYHPNVGEHRRVITWNLLKTTGWDYIESSSYSDCKVFKDDTEILIGFDTVMLIDNTEYAHTTMVISKELITQSVIDLSDYGVSFNEVEWSKIQTEEEYFLANYTNILSMMGFPGTQAVITEDVRLLIPFIINQDKMQIEE